MNRKILLMSTAIACLPAAAMAQPAAVNWTGFYVGASMGAGFNSTTTDYSVPNQWDTDYSVSPANRSEMGFQIGAQVGYSHQFENNFVLGVVGDYSFLTGFNKSFRAPWPDCGGDCDPTIKNDATGLFTLRAKAGFTVGEGTLLYGTAGIGWLNVSDNTDVGDGKGGAFKANKWEPAFVLGGGVEEMICDDWSLAGEVLWVRTQTIDAPATDTSYFDSPGLDVRYTHDLTIARIAVNYHIPN